MSYVGFLLESMAVSDDESFRSSHAGDHAVFLLLPAGTRSNSVVPCIRYSINVMFLVAFDSVTHVFLLPLCPFGGFILILDTIDGVLLFIFALDNSAFLLSLDPFRGFLLLPSTCSASSSFPPSTCSTSSSGSTSACSSANSSKAFVISTSRSSASASVHTSWCSTQSSGLVLLI